MLSTVAKYFFEIDGGKKMRPTMAILMARAIESHKASVSNRKHESISIIVLRIGNASYYYHSYYCVADKDRRGILTTASPSQIRLAEIT